jgi:PAS domain S-box-containing protein
MANTEFNHSEYLPLVEHAPIMVWCANPRAECDFFNHRWLAFTGRTLEKEMGNGWVESIYPDDLHACLNIFLLAFEKREIFERRYRLRRYDGTYRWILDRGAPFYDTEGNFAGYIGSCVDLTERIEAEAVLHQMKAAEEKELKGLSPI